MHSVRTADGHTDRTLWAALAPPAPPTSSLEQSVDVDVAIVGAGFMGLSTALHLAEAGVSTAVLEAERIGFGASGRNTGFVVPSLRASLGIEALREKLGVYGDRLWALVGSSAGIVFDLAARHRLDCAAERTGWVSVAHTEAAMADLRTLAGAWADAGRSVELLDAAGTKERLGIRGYHGALLDPAGGQINPLAFVRGLARVALDKGARVFTQSPARRIERTGERWTVHTDRGRVVAPRLLLATNAMGGSLAPRLATSIVPVVAYQVATQPLGATDLDAILKGRPCVADTRRHTFAVRLSEDNRLVTGGLVFGNASAIRRARSIFIPRLAQRFPSLPPLTSEFTWRGMIATTPDFLPRLYTLGPDFFAAIGCNGRGVAMTTTLGRELASFLSGARAEADLPLPVQPPEPRTAHSLVRFGPAMWLLWSNLCDRLETGMA
ncbi:FAD-binding oxidoreductase [Bauldia sp.]|uniref:NAD(P)/FAD-dependent oxidoreductase n=1 Tax=Bauldia sp. TaxID=2575872 RepID=UPI0025C150F5|nr:FAD-binding oxidoreductase [Bauldia sp.]